MLEFDIDDRQVTNAMRRLLGPDGRAVLRDGNKKAAELVTNQLEREPLSRQQRASIRGGGVRAVGTNRGGVVGFKNRGSSPFTTPAFFGARGRFGWYGWRRYHRSPNRNAQFPKWVGNRFDPGYGGRAGRPYHFSEAEIAQWGRVRDQFVTAWIEAFESVGSS